MIILLNIQEIQMKKSIVIVGTLFTVLASMTFALAAPVSSHDFRFECPNAADGTPSERLTNYGTSVSGMGEESIDGVKSALPIFHGIPSAGVPLDLSAGAYNHAGTLYNEHSGRVTCLFTSSNGSDPFNVSYVASNTKKGYILKSDNNNIIVRIFQGYKE
jgi:hypothetical protein